MFHSFLSDEKKQYAANNNEHSKHLISFLKEKKVMKKSLSKIWENTDGCAKKYRCASALYLMSVMPQCYSIIIDRGIGEPVHGKYVVYGLNAVDKRYVYQLMYTVTIYGSNIFDPQMQIYTGNQKYDISLAK